MIKKILLVVLLIFFAGCATYYNPVTQKTEYTIYSEQDEVALGESIDKKISRELEIVETPEKIKYLGEKISRVSDRPNVKYVFRVVKGEEVNAFAIPGGFIYIYTGLIEKSSVDEIACVIGHEIAHVVARDGVHNLQTNLLYSIPSSILFGSGRYKAIQQSVDTIFSLTMLKYSRKEELRADGLGATYAFRAGYHPEGMITFLQKLKEIEKKNPATNIIFLRSHPDIEERIKNIQETIKNLKIE